MALIELEDIRDALRVKDLAQLLGVSTRHVYRLLDDDAPELAFVRVGSSKRVTRRALADYLERQTTDYVGRHRSEDQ